MNQDLTLYVFIYIGIINIVSFTNGNSPRFFEDTYDSPKDTNDYAENTGDYAQESDCACGTRVMEPYAEQPEKKMLIINGRAESSTRNFPWIASIFYKGHFHCGAIILSPRFFLTTAHCLHHKHEACRPLKSRCFFAPSDISVGVYMHDMEEPYKKIKAKTLIIHRDYKWEVENDIALIKTRKGIECNEYHRHICLGELELPIASDVVIVGFGRTQFDMRAPAYTLHSGTMKSTDDEWCRKYAIESEESILCVRSDEERMQSVCKGDSGGPGFYEMDGRWYVVGVAALMKNGKCPAINIVAMTNISYYYDFVVNHVTDFPEY